MITLNTNLASMIVQSNLQKSTNALNTAIERMTSGYKINGAKDNAANYSITTNMSTKIGAYQVAEDNVAMGLDLLSTASENLDLISDKLTRLRALAEQSANGTYGEQSKQAINAEANALVDEIERLYYTTEYNGIRLYYSKKRYDVVAPGPGLPDKKPGGIEMVKPSSASSSSAPSRAASFQPIIDKPSTDPDREFIDIDIIGLIGSVPINLQVGIDSSKNSSITIDTGFSLTKSKEFAIEALNISFLRGIGKDEENYISEIDNLLTTVSDKQTEYGAVQNRLESALEEISTQYENLVSSRSTLRDADIAEVSSEYIRQQILQQASATLLATANQSPSLALQLI